VIAWGDNDYGQCTVPEGLSGIIIISAESAQRSPSKPTAPWSLGESVLIYKPNKKNNMNDVIKIATGSYQSRRLKKPSMNARTNVFFWDGMTWIKCKSRKPTVCAYSRFEIEKGAEAFRPVTNGHRRGRRLAMVPLAAQILAREGDQS
jgi:hypothetical protein